jgi:hypothetical protein
MSRPVKLFNARVPDGYGRTFDEAVVAVRAFSETSQNTANSVNCISAYHVEQEVEAITYKVNFWYSPETKTEGFRSRPLLVDIAGVFTDVLEVNLDDPGVTQILSGAGDQVDNILNAIEYDFRSKFK